MNAFDPEMFIAAHGWRMDGPHSPDRLASALQTAAELIRYANHATLSRRLVTTMQAQECDPVLGALATMASRFGDLTNRLADYASFTLAADPTLRHDQHTQPGESRQAASDAAFTAAVKLTHARDLAGELAGALREAHGELSHLYHEEKP